MTKILFSVDSHFYTQNSTYKGDRHDVDTIRERDTSNYRQGTYSRDGLQSSTDQTLKTCTKFKFLKIFVDIETTEGDANPINIMPAKASD